MIYSDTTSLTASLNSLAFRSLTHSNAVGGTPLELYLSVAHIQIAGKKIYGSGLRLAETDEKTLVRCGTASGPCKYLVTGALRVEHSESAALHNKVLYVDSLWRVRLSLRNYPPQRIADLVTVASSGHSIVGALGDLHCSNIDSLFLVSGHFSATEFSYINLNLESGAFGLRCNLDNRSLPHDPDVLSFPTLFAELIPQEHK